MKISVRFEGGLGDHLLGNRLIPAIIEKHPESEIHLFSDTNESSFQSEVLNNLYNFYTSTTLLKRKNPNYSILSQFGKENFPAHLDNINEEQKKYMLSFDKFYNLHIDWLGWLDYDFRWQSYFNSFPLPHNKVEDFKHEKYPGSGLAVFFVGNQVAKGTPVEERKKGQKRMLMPQLGSYIWYGRMDFDRRKEPDNLKVISAAEGFFKIEGKKCKFPYMW